MVDTEESGSGDDGSSLGDLLIVILGIFLGAAASVGINIGNNIQSLGLKQREAGKKGNLFRIGTTIFVAASIVNFAAFAFAPASILAPLESFQFVSNLVFNRYVNKAQITKRMVFGVILVIVGCATTVSLGPNKVWATADALPLATLDAIILCITAS